MVGAAAVVLWAATAFAQGKAEFSGTWTREMPAAAAAGAAGGGGRGGRGGGGGGGVFNCGMSCTIVQDAKMLTVKRTSGRQGAPAPADLVFMLDGTDSKITMGGRGGATEVVAKAKWDGNKLVISATRDMGGTMVTSTQTLSIEGGKLTIVTNSGRESATPVTATYTKG
jgi:hypothetical protein